MKRSQFRLVSLIVLVAFVLSIAGGCSSGATATPAGTAVATSAAGKTIVATTASTTTATTTTATTQEIVDSLGAKVVVPKPAKKIASLRSGITEIIAALGQKDKIVAVDEMVKAGSSYGEFITKVHPDLKNRDCPVGSGVNIEELLRIGPDVVLHGGIGRIKQADSIKSQTKIPVVIAHFETLDAYMNDIRIVAKVVEAEDRAEQLITYLQGKLDFVAAKVKDIPENARTKVYYSGHDVYHVYTPETFEHAQITSAGGVNVASDLKGWLPEVSAEQLINWNPQVIVMLNGADVQAVLNDPRLSSLAAVKDKRVYALPEASWDFSSPRALFCIEWLATKLYPDKFKDVNIATEADEFYTKVFGVKYSGPSLTGASQPASATPTSAAAATKTSASSQTGAGLAISGLVAKPVTISADQLKSMAEKVTIDHPKKGKTEMLGVRVSKLLDMTQPKPEAKCFFMKAADGYTGDVPISALRTCADCLLFIGDDPNPDAVLPDMDMGAWVRDLVSIEIK